MEGSNPTVTETLTGSGESSLLPEVVSYLRDSGKQLREEWVRRITDAELLRAMSPEEIDTEVTAVYDNYVDTLETGSVETLQAYARDLSERIIPRGVETDEVLGIVLLLRDVLARALFVKYLEDADLLNRILDAYEPAANRIAVTVGVIDITGVAAIDLNVANHLVQTVEAARLMGASAIITGLSSKIAQTLVDLGVDLSMMKTVGDLQGGLEEADRLIGYRASGSRDALDEADA
jgi:anti-anti-sigma regulatory factor